MADIISSENLNLAQHPLTSKILSGEVNLESINLSQFREGRVVYPTMEEAQCKGFEAHHLIPLKLQKQKLSGVDFPEIKNREQLRKVFQDKIDDRCFRYTAFEHIVDHYLSAKENTEEEEIFANMVRFNFSKLPTDQKELLEKLKDFSILRDKGHEKTSRRKKGKPSERKGISLKEIRNDPNYVSPLKGKTMRERCGENWVSSRKGKTIQEITHNPNYISPLKGKKPSEETRLKISEALKGKKRTEESRRKQAESQKGKTPWNKGKKLSPEIVEKLRESHKGQTISSETVEKIVAKTRGQKRSEETRKNISKALKGKKRTEEQKKRISETHKGKFWFNNGVKELCSSTVPEGFVRGRLPREHVKKNIEN